MELHQRVEVLGALGGSMTVRDWQRKRVLSTAEEVRFGKQGSGSTLADENTPLSPNARQLALAYHIEALIEEGRLQSYAHAARALGVTRARLTLIMNLLTLAPQIQECILLEEKRLHERTLRAMTRLRDWSRQRALLRDDLRSRA